jgi:hypothetical protein
VQEVAPASDLRLAKYNNNNNDDDNFIFGFWLLAFGNYMVPYLRVAFCFLG